MNETAYREIVRRSMQPHAREATIAYLSDRLSSILKPRERVLICFHEDGEDSLAAVMEQAVARCGGLPVLWDSDRRWKTLLQQAFLSRATTMIGTPLVLLGLSKLKRWSRTPLYIRKVISAGYPCPDWMIEGLRKGFDCEAEGCFTLGETGVVAGFSCSHSPGIHLRDQVFDIEIVNREGKTVSDGESGEMVLIPRACPELRYAMGENARLLRETCSCGNGALRLMDLCPGFDTDTDLMNLGQQLQSWTSILDCRMERGESGLEIEIVCFAGEQLPRLPSAAKLVVRPWDPQNDAPFHHRPGPKITE